jgi:hypothetical protein
MCKFFGGFDLAKTNPAKVLAGLTTGGFGLAKTNPAKVLAGLTTGGFGLAKTNPAKVLAGLTTSGFGPFDKLRAGSPQEVANGCQNT